MITKFSLSMFGILCVLGCDGNGSLQSVKEKSQDDATSQPGAAWGHSVGGMPMDPSADVSRTGSETHLSFWGHLWKTPGTPGVAPYSVYDTTVAGQIIITPYDASGVEQGEQDCYWMSNHFDPNGSGQNSYLIMNNVAGGAAPYTYLAVYYFSGGLHICPPHDASGNVRTFASQAAAEADASAASFARANETDLFGVGCNTNVTFTATSTAGEPWIHTTVVGASNVCGDGRVGGSEQCDDANNSNTDACWSCVTATCGDWLVRTGVETCDQGGLNGASVCSSYGYNPGGCFVCNGSCTGYNSVTQQYCGDGVLQGDYEQCDDGNSSNDDVCSSSCTILDGPSFVVQQAALGNGYSCARSTDGVVNCWGDNSNGRLGLSSGVSSVNAPNPSLGGSTTAIGDTAIWLSASYSHTCAILSDGSAKCWGDGSNGKLGLGDTNDIYEPSSSSIGLGTTASAIFAGPSHSCALLSSGGVKCWGRNDYYQLGYDDTTERYEPSGTAVNFSQTVTSMALGQTYSCALFANGDVKCWGASGGGALGIGNFMSFASSGTLPFLDGGGRTATAIASGYDHVCVILNDGAVKCWGANGFGQLGNGNTNGFYDTAYYAPTVNLGSGRTATAIAAGPNHTCAILDNGTVKCWGQNTSGSLGVGTTDNSTNEPTSVVPLTGFTAVNIAAGPAHTCAVSSYGGMKCWGAVDYGQLGSGDFSDSSGAVGDDPGDTILSVSF